MKSPGPKPRKFFRTEAEKSACLEGRTVAAKGFPRNSRPNYPKQEQRDAFDVGFFQWWDDKLAGLPVELPKEGK
jgi:hypothetical protein